VLWGVMTIRPRARVQLKCRRTSSISSGFDLTLAYRMRGVIYRRRSKMRSRSTMWGFEMAFIMAILFKKH
jgi:hypothetical protein